MQWKIACWEGSALAGLPMDGVSLQPLTLECVRGELLWRYRSS